MTYMKSLYDRLVAAMGVDGLRIPTTLVKLYRRDEEVPEAVMVHHPDDITLTSCQASRQASLGDAICLSRRNMGCIAAAISLGLVDQNETEPLEGSRVYTDIMKDRSENRDHFRAPSPADFTEGLVYACKAAAREDFCLFDQDDGRYADVATSREAVRGMIAIQPAIIQAVFFHPPDFEDADITPDVVICDIRPVELTRFIQAWQYNTGRRLDVSMGGLRAVNSDLIAWPYLTGEINLSPYCLGSRLIAQYEPDRLGIGMPLSAFETIVKGMEDSRRGFPFHLYPGADPLA